MERVTYPLAGGDEIINEDEYDSLMSEEAPTEYVETAKKVLVECLTSIDPPNIVY